MRTAIHFPMRAACALPFAVLLTVPLLLNACAATGTASEGGTTTVYFLRHAEQDPKDPDRPLTDRGRARAGTLVAHLAAIPITHVYASHTDRTRDTVMPLARSRSVSVHQFPPVGSDLDGKVVGNRTRSEAAIQPLVAALKALPAGSTAVVACNSENLYPVMAGLGAPILAECTAERTDCLPCPTRKCFDGKSYDRIWILTLLPNGRTSLNRTRYGN